MAIARWVFDDGAGDTWEVPKNPKEMGSVHRRREIRILGTTAVDGRDLLWEGRSKPKDWTFTGTTHDYAHYENLRIWVYDKVQRIWITDHFGRRLTVVLEDLDAKPKMKYGKYWHHEYTVSGKVLAVGAATVGV